MATESDSEGSKNSFASFGDQQMTISKTTRNITIAEKDKDMLSYSD